MNKFERRVLVPTIKETDNRQSLLQKLASYVGSTPDEEQMRLATVKFVTQNANCFDRSLLIGHVNGSAWVVDRTLTHTLLTHHNKLDKWLQLGGHSDGNPDTLEVALREAQEESGLMDIQPLHTNIYDIDVHTIPERGDEPEHLHYDVRFIFVANMAQPLTVSSESKDLQWIPLTEIHTYNPSKSLRRMIDKTPKSSN